MAKEPMVVLEVTMTPEDYILIKRNANWEGKTVTQYIMSRVLSGTRHGC